MNKHTHRHILHNNIIHPFRKSDTYLNTIFSSHFTGGFLALFTCFPFLFGYDYFIISFFDIACGFYLLFLDLIVIIFVLFLLSFYIRNIVWIKYSNNSEFLWRLFREKQQQKPNSWNWIKESATADILRHYTKQLIDLEYSFEIDKLKSNNLFHKLEFGFSDFYKDRDFFSYKKEFYIRRNHILSNKRLLVSKISSFIRLINDFKKQFINLRDLQGSKFTNVFLRDFIVSKSFDYNRYVTDSLYSSYYKVVLDDGLKLSIFIARGVKRDNFIYQIYLQEDETYPEMLSLGQEEANILLEKKWNIVLDWLYLYDKIIGFKLPNWMIHKDIGGIFLKSKLGDTNRKEIYIFNQSTILFDVFFISFGLLPFFMLQFFYSLYFPLHFGIRLATIQDLFTLFKLFIMNIIPISVQDFLKNLGLNSWVWSTRDMRTPGNGYPAKFNFVYGNHFYMDLFYLDPFFTYDSIFKEFHDQILYYNEKGYYTRSWNFNIIIFLRHYALLLEDWLILSNSSWKLFNFIFVFVFFLFMGFYFLLFRLRHFSLKRDVTNVEIKFFIYLDKVYNINKIKWNNYLRKIWF